MSLLDEESHFGGGYRPNAIARRSGGRGSGLRGLSLRNLHMPNLDILRPTKKKVLGLVGGLVLLQGYANDGNPLPNKYVPSGIDVVSGTIDATGTTLKWTGDRIHNGADWVDDKLDGLFAKDSTSSANTTYSPPPQTAPPANLETTPAPQAGVAVETTIPSFGTGETLPPLPTVAATAAPVVPAETGAAAPTGEVAFQSVSSFGTISCASTVEVTTQARENDPSTESSPLTNMGNAAHQDFDKLQSAAADQFWLDVRAMPQNAPLQLPDRPAIGTVYTGPANCSFPEGIFLP